MANEDRIIARASFHHESKVQMVEGLPAFIVTNRHHRGGPATPSLASMRPSRSPAQVDELEASLTYAMDNGLELTIWGRNMTNDRNISTVFDSPAQQWFGLGLHQPAAHLGRLGPLPFLIGR